MTRSRATLGFLTIAATLMLAAGPAHAQDTPSITVEPSTDLSDGDTVTVTASGFPASSETFVSGQCVTPISDPLQQCNVANIVPVALDADGAATFTITVNTGTIGTGTCGPGGDDCVILVGSLTEPENAAAPITFAQPELAATGPEHVLPLSVIATLLLAAGAALVLSSRRPFQDQATG